MSERMLVYIADVQLRNTLCLMLAVGAVALALGWTWTRKPSRSLPAWLNRLISGGMTFLLVAAPLSFYVLVAVVRLTGWGE